MDTGKEIEKLEILAEICKEYNVSFSGVESNAVISAMDKWQELASKNYISSDEAKTDDKQSGIKSTEDIYVSHGNDGEDDVYCAFTDHTRGLKDCEEAGALLTVVTLHRGK